MNGTARKITPGTRVATVTGIHTCWPRRSIVSISSPLDVAADGAGLLGDSRPRSPASRLRASTGTSRSSASTSATAAHSRSASTSVRPWRMRPHDPGAGRWPPRPGPAAASRLRAAPSE